MRRMRQVAAGGVLIAVLAGCGADPRPAESGPPTATGTPSSPAPAAPAPSATPSPALTDRQLLGQRVIYSYRGATPPASLLKAIRRGEAAGVIFFTPNIPSKATLRKAVALLVKANAASPVKAPLLLMTDQEGGVVRRLPGAPDLSARQVGLAADPAAQAVRTGRETAANLRGAGLNVNLAPVLDVYRTRGDFADRFGRSYGRDPAKVAALASAFVKAQRSGGVLGTAKHFPGLGTAPTAANTDLRPVTLKVPAATLRAVDEAPYGPVIAAGVPMVMVSWATYPALDPSRPAGLSRKIIGGELRRRVGFTGVTITDALEAGALRAYGSTARRGVLAAAAGMDLLMFSAQNTDAGLSGLAALRKALASGRLDRAETEAAAARIQTLRTSLR